MDIPQHIAYLGLRQPLGVSWATLARLIRGLIRHNSYVHFQTQLGGISRRPLALTAHSPPDDCPLTLHIRPAQFSDAPQILAFITELADYERARHEVIASVEDIQRSLFGEGATARSLICLQDGQPIGFAVYFFSYSTWLGCNGLYLEDLYVSPESRGTGAGKALLKQLAREAVAKDCGRLEWSVLDWNEPAIEFYKSIGALPQDEWVRYRMEGQGLRRFAES